MSGWGLILAIWAAGAAVIWIGGARMSWRDARAVRSERQGLAFFMAADFGFGLTWPIVLIGCGAAGLLYWLLTFERRPG